MNKIFISIVIFILSASLHCQEMEPQAMSFTYNGVIGTLNSFGLNQNKFIISPQWGSPPRLLRSLNFTALQDNFYEENYPQPTPGLDKKLLAIVTPIQNFPMFVQSFQFEPTLQTTYKGELKIRDPMNPDDDPEGSIFGFNYIWNYANTRQVGTGQNKKYWLGLENADNPTNQKILVLSEHPMQDQLCYLGDDKDPNTPDNKWNGEDWYISVNLRVKDDLKNMAGNPEDKILGIVIKTKIGTYTGKVDGQNIRFHKFPNPDFIDPFLCQNGNRGWTYADGPKLGEKEQEFIITRDMLPYNDKTAIGITSTPIPVNGNVTISALFKCNSNSFFNAI